MKNNKALIGVFAAVIIAAAIIAVLVAKNAGAPGAVQPTPEPQATAVPTNAPEEDNAAEPAGSPAAEAKEPTAEPEQKVYTPTFMYFVSNSDEGYDATMVMIEELKKEFDGRINFDIRNIDEDPELVERFPVKDNTPTLIMLNTKNDISNILFKTKDKDKLKEAINAALEG